MTSADYATVYRKRGWYPIPIPTRSKVPPIPGWPLLRLNIEEIPKHFTGAMNIGILTGSVSKHLVDIDLDNQAAIRLAPRFLTSTIMFGRASKPLSHWVYTSYGARTEVFASPSKLSGEKVQAVTLVELRADGKQTIFPCGVHESGETIDWATNVDQQPTDMKAHPLRMAVAGLATACLLIQFGWNDEDAIAFASHPNPTAITNLPPEVKGLVARWLGPVATPKEKKSSAAPTPETSFEIAVTRWNGEHPLTFTKRNTGPCPVCNDTRSFGQLRDNPEKWSCFSTDHPDDVGIRSPNQDCFLGDALDLEAFKRGKTRAQVLRDDGFLHSQAERKAPHLKVVQVPSQADSSEAPLPEPPPDGEPDEEDWGPPTPPSEDDNRPHILLGPEAHEVVDQTISALLSSTEIFQRGTHLVRVTSAVRSPMHTEIFGPTPSIEPISGPTLLESVTKHAKIFKFDARKKDYIQTLPPPWLVNGVLDRGNWRGLRPLEGIVEVPTIRLDGTMLITPGYDQHTGLIYQPAIAFELVKDHPTREDAQRAIQELLDLVVDFPFAAPSPLYKAAWLAAVLTPFVRNSIPTAPMFLVDSNIRGSGKSKLCDIVSTISTGRPMPRTVNPPHDEEFKKLVTSLAIAGSSLVMIDNITGSLGSQALDAVLTAPTWKDRILGKSEMTKEIPLTTIWFATGNNVELRGDLVRRTIHIHLKTNDENPETRQHFKYPNLMEHVQQHRGHYVACALTVLRAYVTAGALPQPMRAVDFREWSAIVRGALIWAGQSDPGETQIELAQGDSDRTGLALLLEALERFPESAFGLSTSAILKFAMMGGENADALREAIGELCPTRDGKVPSAVSLGKRLGALKGRVVNGRCIEKSGEKDASNVWAVKKIGKDA